MWEDVIYTNAQAKLRFLEIEADPENCAPRVIKKPFKYIRDTIINEKEIFLMDNLNKINSYNFDLHIGLILYRILKEFCGFSERLAAKNELWRYISLEVLPDLVYERVGINEQRYYKGTRRIWLKSVWWYIHLSWQGTEEETFNTLKDFTSDEILQLLDRSGSGGYRVELTREIMRQYKEYSSSRVPLLFRRVLKLNTARLKMVEPSLVGGGIEQYVNDLFVYILSVNNNINEMSRLNGSSTKN